MENDYELIAKDGKHYLTYKGVTLPDNIETIVKQDSEDAYLGICLVTISVVAKIKNSE